jgi:hypothetical protein
MNKVTAAKAIAQAEAFKAIGQTRVYLSELDDSQDNFPWQYVTKVETGSTHSYIGPRAIGFTAEHPCGLEFYWSLDLSPSGMGSVERRQFFNHTAIAKMADSLPSDDMRREFASVIRGDVLPPLRKQIEEARAHLNALLEGENTLLGVSAKSASPSHPKEPVL